MSDIILGYEITILNWIIGGIAFGLAILSLKLYYHRLKIYSLFLSDDKNSNHKLLTRPILTGFLIVIAFILLEFPWTIGNVEGVQISVNGWGEIVSNGGNSITSFSSKYFMNYFLPIIFISSEIFLMLFIWSLILLGDKYDFKFSRICSQQLKICLWTSVLVIFYELYIFPLINGIYINFTITPYFYAVIIIFFLLELPKRRFEIKDDDLKYGDKILPFKMIYWTLNPFFMILLQNLCWIFLY